MTNFESRYVDYPDPVRIPAYDMVRTERGRYPVLRLPLGEDKKGRAYDFAIGIRKARAILRFIDSVRDFVDKHDG